MNSRPIGREAEVGKICAFLTASSGEPTAVAITGDVGIGKTAVWKHVAQAALQDGQPAGVTCSFAPASVVPTALGVNPSKTIAALAERGIERVLAERGP